MGIPLNDSDLNTPEQVWNRIRANKEFELKEIQFNIANGCPNAIIGYNGHDYIVNFKVESTQIAPDFMVCHPLPDEGAKKLKDAKVGLTLFFTFSDDIFESYHFQLKLLNCAAGDLAAVIDFNTHRIYSPMWLKSVCNSQIHPGPNFLFSVTCLPSSNGKTCWIYTFGLNRCGYVELEILDAEKEDSNFFAQVLNIIATKAVVDMKFPDEGKPMDLAALGNGEYLSYTWKYWRDDIDSYTPGILGTAQTRSRERCRYNGMLYLYPVPRNSRDAVRACDFATLDMSHVVFELSGSESRRLEALAAETLPMFKKGLDINGTKGMAKIRVSAQKDENEEQSYEYLWMEVDALENDTLYGKAMQSTVFSNEVTENEKIQSPSNAVADWVIVIKEDERITPDRAFLLEDF